MRPALGRGVAVGLAEHRQHERHHRGASRAERDVRVRGVAGEQQTGGASAEAPREQSRRRGEQVAHEGRAAAGHGGQPRQPGSACPQRREGGEQPLDQRVADVVPLVAQPQPGVAVTRVSNLHRGGRDLPVPVEQRPLPVRGGVPEHGGGVPPAQPVLLEAKGAQRRRGHGEGVEGARRVVDEVRVHRTGAVHRPADLGRGLEHEDRPAGVGEQVGGDEAVRARADDDGVDGSRCAHPFVATARKTG